MQYQSGENNMEQCNVQHETGKNHMESEKGNVWCLFEAAAQLRDLLLF